MRESDAGAEDLSGGPAGAHRSRLDERRKALSLLDRRDIRLSIARGAAVGSAILAWAVSAGEPWIAAGILAFLVLVLVHERTARQQKRARRRVAFHETALRRVNEEWAGHGEAGVRFADPRHPYSGDLDLFGSGSMFERLCTARTRSGEDTLAAWLLSPAGVETVRERQAAAKELRPRIELREDLAVLGGEARRSVDSVSLRRWLEASPSTVPPAVRVAAVVTTGATLVTLGQWLSGAWEIGPFTTSLGAVWLVRYAARRWTAPVLTGVDRPGRDLQTLSELIGHLETEQFESPLLGRLQAAFVDRGARVSREILRLRRLVDLADSRGNLIFAPIAFALGWEIHMAVAIERWRRRVGPAAAAALHALGEIEALLALAAYAFERPADVFPEIVTEGPLFEARGIGHPLIPRARCVRNDLQLGAGRNLLVVTGSNMSGKSTLLRSVGLGVVLAQAGAPVPARELRLSPLTVATSIRVLDSLQEGRSRFYAEITRIRQVMDLAAQPGLLFLLDEIFHGTNSADRSAGAAAVIRTLVRKAAIGLVTSHDLALAAIADELAPLGDNIHFEDHLEGDQIAFDFRIKPGPVRKSNALALMRAVGLEV